jgi:hypothetical protein
MGDVLMPLLLGVWLVASAWGADRLVKLLDGALCDKAWQLVMQMLAFAVLLPLPLADELITKPRFDALCRERARLDIHLPEYLGLPTHRQGLMPEPVAALGLSVEVQPWWVVLDGNGLVLASYATVQARGGWLARWVHADPAQKPLSFTGHCEPADLENRLQPRVPPAPPGTSIGKFDGRVIRLL